MNRRLASWSGAGGVWKLRDWHSVLGAQLWLCAPEGPGVPRAPHPGPALQPPPALREAGAQARECPHCLPRQRRVLDSPGSGQSPSPSPLLEPQRLLSGQTEQDHRDHRLRRHPEWRPPLRGTHRLWRCPALSASCTPQLLARGAGLLGHPSNAHTGQQGREQGVAGLVSPELCLGAGALTPCEGTAQVGSARRPRLAHGLSRGPACQRHCVPGLGFSADWTRHRCSRRGAWSRGDGRGPLPGAAAITRPPHLPRSSLPGSPPSPAARACAAAGHPAQAPAPRLELLTTRAGSFSHLL